MGDGTPDLPGNTAEVDVKLNGVRGWLLFLCISWVVLAPVVSMVTVFQLSRVLVETREIRDILRVVYPAYRPVVIISTVINLGVALFSLVAGLRLWTVRPAAVRTAKAFLIFMAVTNLTNAILLKVILGPMGEESMTSDTVTTVIRSLVWVGIWYAYFSRSKRVATTYAQTG